MKYILFKIVTGLAIIALALAFGRVLYLEDRKKESKERQVLEWQKQLAHDAGFFEGVRSTLAHIHHAGTNWNLELSEVVDDLNRTNK